MENLALRLQQRDEAGVYQMTCTVIDVRAAAAESDFVVFDVDLENVHSKGQFLAAVAQSIKAPDWLGMNWDALADVLGDLSWRPAPGYVLLLRNGDDSFNLGEHDHQIAMAILQDTVEYWRTQGKSFWVLYC